MKILAMKTSKFCLMTVAMLLSLWGSAAFAESYDLVAGPTTATMPDGKVVAMWGYGMCASGDATFTNCGTARVPGPPLISTDGTLTINLRNDLPEPTSIVINGQATALTPVWINLATGAVVGTGSRPTPTNAADPNDPAYRYRVRSFTHEADAVTAAPSNTATYTWTGMKPGTFLYQTGTHPAKQVQMGLYGAMSYNDGAYPGVAFASDAILLFSEIDPALHDAVAAGTYGIPPLTSTIDYKPKYFLINGQPFGAGQAPLNALTPATAGETILLRLLNAGLDNREVVVQGQRPTLYAEDGNLLPFAFQHNGLLLPAGKTLDATITPAADGYLPVFDRRLALSNAASSPGGMLAYLQVGAASQTLTVNKAGTGTVNAISAPGGINCGADCSDTYLIDTDILLTAIPAPGSAFNPVTGWTGCDSVLGSGDCLVTMSGAKNVTASFQQTTVVTLFSPNGGEVLPAGSRHTITWGAQAAAVKFNLDFSLNNGLTWQRIARGVTGTSFNWLVPITAGNRNKCLVRVIGINDAGRVVGRDRSNAPFAIQVVKLTSPNGGVGVAITSGNVQTITWTTANTVSPVAQVRLSYTINGGLSWIPLLPTLTVNTGTFNWTVPTVTAPRSKSKVRVILKNDAGATIGADVSDLFFTIQPL